MRRSLRLSGWAFLLRILCPNMSQTFSMGFGSRIQEVKGTLPTLYSWTAETHEHCAAEHYHPWMLARDESITLVYFRCCELGSIAVEYTDDVASKGVELVCDMDIIRFLGAFRGLSVNWSFLATYSFGCCSEFRTSMDGSNVSIFSSCVHTRLPWSWSISRWSGLIMTFDRPTSQCRAATASDIQAIRMSIAWFLDSSSNRGTHSTVWEPLSQLKIFILKLFAHSVNLYYSSDEQQGIWFF